MAKIFADERSCTYRLVEKDESPNLNPPLGLNKAALLAGYSENQLNASKPDITEETQTLLVSFRNGRQWIEVIQLHSLTATIRK